MSVKYFNSIDNNNKEQYNIEYNVSGFSLGPATLAYNSLSKITNSDRTPSLTNVHP